MTIRFIVTDIAREVSVIYHGLLPSLFRGSKGAVVRSRLGEDGVLVANEVLIEHDEDYISPEAADAVCRVMQAEEQVAKESVRGASRRSPSWVTSRRPSRC